MKGGHLGPMPSECVRDEGKDEALAASLGQGALVVAISARESDSPETYSGSCSFAHRCSRKESHQARQTPKRAARREVGHMPTVKQVPYSGCKDVLSVALDW